MDTNTGTPNDKRRHFISTKKMQKKFSPLSFAGGMMIVVLAFGLIYMIVPRQTNEGKYGNNNIVLEQDSSVFTGEHFYKIHHHKHIDKDVEALVLMPEEVAMIEKGKLTDKQRKLVELLPNAPSIYLYDLKVTEYQKLYYQPDGSVVTIGDTSAPAIINQAMKNFESGHFDVVVNKLKILLRFNKDDPNALFYSGASYYYQKNYPQALIMLNRIGNLSNNVFRQDAYWYKALCFIDLKKTNEAKTLLQQIIDAQGFYTEKAKQQLTLIK